MAEPEMMETVGDVLGAAADLIEKRGWTQSAYTSPEGCLCTVGAINVSLSGRPIGVSEELRPVAWGAMEALRVTTECGLLTIARWNDVPTRTKPEVLRTLRLAAWVYNDQPLPIPVVRHG